MNYEGARRVSPSVNKRICPDCGLEYVPKGKGRGCPHCLLRLAMPETEGEVLTREAPPPFGLRSRYFAGYEILEEIARGGMGVVYRARQLNLNREVALKMIQAMHLVSLEARLRFRVEIEAVAPMNHPNIVSLYESGEYEGVHYFTMRLVDGGNLGDYLQKEHPLREMIRLLIKVCRTVHYAHQRGVLHRDLKPSNILMDLQGEPLVADFGLAKSLDHETAFTYSHSILGSPNYMAPEQATSHSGPVSTAVDVYGLGAILFHMLTGRPPFQGKTALETIRQVVDTDPPSPRRLNPQIDVDLATICLKALEKKPVDRYGSAEELAHDLEQWLGGLPIRARPVGAVGTTWRWARRHPAVTTLSAALALAALAFLIGIPIAMMRIRNAQQEAVSHLRVSLLDQARILRLSNPMGVRSEIIRLIQQAVSHGGPPEFQERARDELLATLAITDMDFSPQAPAPSVDSELSLLDPGFERIAFASERTNLVIRRLEDGKELLHLPAGESPISKIEAFSPDGRFLALRHTNGLSFWDTETGTLGFATNGPARVYCFASHAPRLFLEEWDYTITVLELPEFKVLKRFKADPNSPDDPPRGWTHLSVSPDGTRLAGVRSFENRVELFDVDSGRTQWSHPNDDPITALTWETLHSRLVTASSDGLARMRRWDDGTVNAILNLGGPVHSITLDGTKSILASFGTDRMVRLWNLVAYRQIAQFPCDAHDLKFDGTNLRLGGVQLGDKIGWLDLSQTREFQEMVLANAQYEIERCSFNGDGRIVAGGLSGQIDLRRVSDGRRLSQFGVQRLPIFAFDPLGEGLVTSASGGVAYHPMAEETPGQLQVHVPRMIVRGPRWRSVAFSGDGQRFYAANGFSNTVYGFDRTLTNCVVTLGPHVNVDRLATTQDGSLVATGSTEQRDVRVWDATTQTERLSVPMSSRSFVNLSSDGRWLLVHGENFDLRDLSNGQSVSLPFTKNRLMLGAGCFSPDSRVLAVVIDQYEILLFDLVTRNTLGRLRGPRDAHMNALAFSPDASRISAACSEGRLRIWNISRMRRELAELNLDWENSPFPDPQPVTAANEPPLTVLWHPQ